MHPNLPTSSDKHTHSLHDALPIFVAECPHRGLHDDLQRAPIGPELLDRRTAHLADEHDFLGIELAQDLLALGRGGHSAPDRKSTRLNSSHVEISYAVFCLKKKKLH